MEDQPKIDIENNFRYGDLNSLLHLSKIYEDKKSGGNVKPITGFDNYFVTMHYEVLNDKKKKVISGLLRRTSATDDSFIFVYPLWKDGVKHCLTMKEIILIARGENGVRMYESTLSRSFKGR